MLQREPSSPSISDASACGSAASSRGFLGEHPGFHVCSYFYSFEILLLLTALQVDIGFYFLNFFSSLKDVVFLY